MRNTKLKWKRAGGGRFHTHRWRGFDQHGRWHSTVCKNTDDGEHGPIGTWYVRSPENQIGDYLTAQQAMVAAEMAVFHVEQEEEEG